MEAEHKSTQSHEPRRATHARDNKPTKETESSTDKISAEHSALDQGKAGSKSKRNTEKGRAACTKHERKQQKHALERYECTCHVYGQTHKYREPCPNTIHLGGWDTSAPVTSTERYASENEEPK